MLTARRDDRWHTVRVFDNAHDPKEHHEHRYVGEEKQPPTVTHGPVNDALHAAILVCRESWADIVREWAWELLHDERKAVVLVTTDHEILAVPRRHNPLLHWLDGVRGSTPVLVQWRAHGREREPYAVATHVGRHPLGRMRELAHAA